MISVIGMNNDAQEIQKMEQNAKVKQKACAIAIIAITAIVMALSTIFIVWLCKNDMMIATPIAMCICFGLAIILADSYKSTVKTKLHWSNFTPATYKYHKVAETYKKGMSPTVYYQSTESRDHFDMFAYDQSKHGNPIPVKIGTFKRKIVSVNDYDDVVFDLTNMICLDPE